MAKASFGAAGQWQDPDAIMSKKISRASCFTRFRVTDVDRDTIIIDQHA